MTEGSILRNYADVLVILMRLRQLCCHPDLSARSSSDAGRPCCYFIYSLIAAFAAPAFSLSQT